MLCRHMRDARCAMWFPIGAGSAQTNTDLERRQNACAEASVFGLIRRLRVLVMVKSCPWTMAYSSGLRAHRAVRAALRRSNVALILSHLLVTLFFSNVFSLNRMITVKMLTD